jgi:hypothetical protein
MPITKEQFSDFNGLKISPLRENDNYIGIQRGNNGQYILIIFLAHKNTNNVQTKVVTVYEPKAYAQFISEEEAVNKAIEIWETI